MTAPTFPLRFVDAGESDVSRRTFLKLMGAGALAAGAAACAKPAGDIVPYVSQPPEVVPGVSQYFSTAMELDGYGTGLLAESREGRPIKIEGNPRHPASLGAASALHQAAVLQLYDADRPEFIRHAGTVATWSDCAAAFDLSELRRVGGGDGSGVFFLLEPTASPIVAALVDRIRERMPGAHFHWYSPLVTRSAAEGAALAFGSAREPVFDLSQADTILAADADVLAEGPFHLRYARQFADRRRVRTTGDTMNRLYVVEGRFTPTGIAADHRLIARPSEVTAVLAALLREAIAAEGTSAAVPSAASAAARQLAGSPAGGDWARTVARDLIAHRGRAAVVVGPRQPAVAHAMGAALNEALGANGRSVSYVDPLLPRADSLADLVEAMRAGRVQALVTIGGNPSYNAPADSEFAELFRRVPLTMFAGEYENETAADAKWFVPLAHFLEAWGDTRACDGTASIVQPLIAPLHGAMSSVELLAFFAGDDRPPYEVLRGFWLAADRLAGDADAWQEALRHGIVPGTAAPARESAVDWSRLASALTAASSAPVPDVEVAFAPDPSVHDGRFANNAWLQEMPDPVTKLTWDNAAYMSRATLKAIGVEPSQVIEIAANGRRLRAPAFAAPGVADHLIVLPFGYGRRGAENVARGVGANAFALWTSAGFSASASARPALDYGLRQWHDFAVTETHWTLDGRPIVLEADLDRFKANPGFTGEQKRDEPALYSPEARGGQQWAMAIDLSVCTGCSACVIACQAENNVPVVGKPGVLERREMHWLRIDRYLTEAGGQPRITTQPMLCQQCEAAPCEYVCPVNATVHSPDGLNEMVYNRCVGTRFCSNNCPYKVRRFNFLNYTQELPETEQMAMNPDVTVRARGVMEKCTFCVQRIRRADIDASLQGSDAPYAALQTACQQACPTRAIVFGSLTAPESPVSRDARAAHSYHVLNDLGTRPRISYLARLRNPNHDLHEDLA